MPQSDSAVSSSRILPYVICGLKKQLIGISTEYVKELVVLPRITSLPDTPPEIRGIFNNRGSLVQVIDLRLQFEMESSLKELDNLILLMHQREQDHLNWLNELFLSTKEKRPFKLTTDPHNCAFGKWYDSFTTTNYTLTAQLEKFDAPHKIIHSIAFEIEKMKAEGNLDSAFALIEKTRENELRTMQCLFEETRQLLIKTHREIAVIIQVGSRISALAVDRVESVEHLSGESIESCTQKNSIIPLIAKRSGTQQFVQLLDPIKLYS